MRLFLCSHFAKVGTLLQGEVEGKNVAFIPTASINEGYKGYVGSARKLWKSLKANITEVEISTASINDIENTLATADIIYFTGGNSFFLIDQLRKTGTDKLLKRELDKGKLYVGESGGAIVCAPALSYIERMDPIPDDYSQKDDAGLNLIDFYVVPHYLCPPFKKCSDEIVKAFPELDICAINNSQAVLVEDGNRTELSI
ncbi:Type 1 glutamine amidotransferase-like domain-containing protein [Aerococcaceae bacterium NML191219]|nr:Type 1 glutamine amidotransferase-like domain-containing protein [Aerococcaceae bacterium NML191219]